MYDSDFNMRKQFYEESRESAMAEENAVTIEKRTCPQCGIYTITNLARCIRCGHLLPAIVGKEDESNKDKR